MRTRLLQWQVLLVTQWGWEPFKLFFGQYLVSNICVLFRMSLFFLLTLISKLHSDAEVC